MAETNGATGTQADPGTQPPAGDAKSQADDAGEGQSQQPESISLEEAKKLRSEAASLRKRLHDLETKAQKDAEASLSEQEKALAQARREGASEAMTKVSASFRRNAVRSELTAAGANPDLLDLAVNDEQFAELRVTDDGEVEGVKEAVAAIKKARPSLFTRVVPTGDAGGGVRTSASPTDFNAQLRRAAGRA